MTRNENIFTASIIIFGVILGISGVFLQVNSLNQLETTKTNNEYLAISKGLTLVDAKFNNPKVIIQTDSFPSLLLKAKEVNTTTIYKTYADGYVVVDSAFTYAYSYTPPTGFDQIAFIMIVTGVMIAFATAMSWGIAS